MIYKKIVDGKVFTTNNNGVIEVFTASEMEEIKQRSWWSNVVKKYF